MTTFRHYRKIEIVASLVMWVITIGVASIWQPCGAGSRTSSRPTMGCLDSRMHGEGKRVFWDRFLSKWS